MTDFSDIYSSMSLNGNDRSDNISGTNSSLNALRLNTLLSNSLDLRQPTLESRHNIDSMWNDGNKVRNSMDGEMTLGRLLAQTYSYSSDSSISPCTSKSRYSPPQVSRGNGIFSYGDDSPHSIGSNSSRHSFNYSSLGSGGSYQGRGLRMSSVSDPGSPTLDDAILMGCPMPDSPFLNSSANSNNATLQSQENSLIELMNSLAVNNNNNNNNGSLVGNGILNGHMSNNRQSQNNSSSQIHCPSTSHLSSTNNSLLANSLGINSCLNIGSNNHGNASSLLSQGSPNSLSQLSSSSNSLLANSFGLNNSLNNSLNIGGNSASMLSQGMNDLSLAQLQGMWLNSQLCSNLSLGSSDPYAIEKAAKMHRNAAALCDATCTWSGQLPMRVTKNPFYSCKVFLGGVPWDVTEMTLRQAFIQFGNIQVEWPGKENSANPPRGYVYILFENEKQVKALLAACTQDSTENYYFKISSRRMRQKEVQVIPWVISDSNYVRCPSYQLDPAKTVFVGALHGMLSAEALANIMNDLFGGVVYSGIDTDKHKYPIGSGRVTFNNVPAYRKAVRAAFIEIKTPKFTKKVQVDPYLADSLCQSCGLQPGPYFCRDENCFKYYCRTCWHLHHSGSGEIISHKPLMRDPKLRTQTALSRVM